MIDGIINVNKEAGFTSHDVVAKLRGILRQKKIGHTGTLDPETTGVLPVCLGKGTRLCDMLTDRKKTYEAVMRLGIETDTQDMTGTIIAQREVTCSQKDIREAVESFLGDQLQIPPMYSALKVNGKKLYELAREGKEVERKARPVHFYRLEILEADRLQVRFLATCSKGTYIRTLCHDIGKKLGCGAAMERLIRTEVGGFTLQESHTLREIEEYVAAGRLDEVVHPVETLFSEYPEVVCPVKLDRLLHNGNPLSVEALGGKLLDGWVRFYDSQKTFVGIYERKPGTSRYFPVKMFYPS